MYNCLLLGFLLSFLRRSKMGVFIESFLCMAYVVRHVEGVFTRFRV
jgi:hypothetical protein